MIVEGGDAVSISDAGRQGNPCKAARTLLLSPVRIQILYMVGRKPSFPNNAAVIKVLHEFPAVKLSSLFLKLHVEVRVEASYEFC
jgi:hypothetical protein